MIEKIIRKRAKRSRMWLLPHDDLVKLVNNSKTFKEILDFFGFADRGGNIATLKRRLNEESIDYSHIPCGLNSNKGRSFDIKPIPSNELFCENCSHSRSTLKKYILKNNLIPYKCSICGQEPFWNNEELVLVLDHNNGIRNDNRLENLRFLCPNCNSQQETFAGKNNKRIKDNFCIDCGKKISKTSTRCKSCTGKLQKSPYCKRPSKETLEDKIKTMSNVQIGKEYSVSEASVRKWLKYYNLTREEHNEE